MTLTYISYYNDLPNVGVIPNFLEFLSLSSIFVCIHVAICDPVQDVETVSEPRGEKTSFLHMQKQRRRSASR